MARKQKDPDQLQTELRARLAGRTAQASAPLDHIHDWDDIQNKPAFDGIHRNLDGGVANSVYLPSQVINGGTASG